MFAIAFDLHEGLADHHAWIFLAIGYTELNSCAVNLGSSLTEPNQPLSGFRKQRFALEPKLDDCFGNCIVVCKQSGDGCPNAAHVFRARCDEPLPKEWIVVEERRRRPDDDGHAK